LSFFLRNPHQKTEDRRQKTEDRKKHDTGNLQNMSYLSPSPFQGEGWDGGDQKTFELFYYPLPSPPSEKGRETSRHITNEEINTYLNTNNEKKASFS
jgi:hypothetical protein